MKKINKKSMVQNIDNKGFSLVELIICVAILGIAVVPLIQTFGNAAKTNGKAQKLQNATSLAESIMEEVKSNSIDSLGAAYNGVDGSGTPNKISIAVDETDFWDTASTGRTRAEWADAAAGSGAALLTGGDTDTPYYVLYKPSVTTTQGEEYNATVSIRTSTYKIDGATVSANSANVAAANSVKLPQIEEIDTLSQTVLSSKELFKYDKAAQDYFNQRKADFDPNDDLTAATITSKVVTIDKSDISTDAIKVTCSITYKDGANNPYTRDIYVGTYVQQSHTEESGIVYEPLNSNIYLFTRKAKVSEGECEISEIKIDDTSTIGSHKVYLIMLDEVGASLRDIGGTKISLSITEGSNNSFTLDDNSDVDANGSWPADSDDPIFISNLTPTSSMDGHIYLEDDDIKIYDVTVELTKSGEDKVFATLQSTVSAD